MRALSQAWQLNQQAPPIDRGALRVAPEFRAIGLAAEHDRGLRANNRAENSHQPVRRRERKLQMFKSTGSVQRFLSIHSATYNTFYHQRHLLKRPMFKELRTASFGAWQAASVATTGAASGLWAALVRFRRWLIEAGPRTHSGKRTFRN